MNVQQGCENISIAHFSYNVAPGSRIIVLLLNHNQEKAWDRLQWGIMPAWKQPKRVINARAEMVRQKSMFRKSWQQRRVLIPVTAYYEWRRVENTKQPYCIRRKHGYPFLLAGLYKEDECVIITRPARKDITFIHDRMPVIIDDFLADAYLNQANVAHEMLFLGHDYYNLEIYPVTKRIGNPKFNEPRCLESIDFE